MEVKQEVNVYICKGEIDNEGGNDLCDTLKIEIKEEPKRESTNDGFEYLVLPENPIKTEKETYEDKLIPFEEKETSEKKMAPKRNYSKEQLAKALENVKKEIPSSYTAAKIHRFPHSTLRHKRD
ncbi:unnamed protein product [Diabrotica balteata]|uniref:Uncharacterized protein n=1 Tax=Diabrotica balteata TaxID=107213 RepID=A0A9N9XL22_DIABA|nr:unnamed protein product [Diabrotica balteata]